MAINIAAGMLLPETSATAINRGPSVGAAKCVIVIAPDCLGRACGERNIYAGHVGSPAGHQPALDLTGDLDISLHRNVIAEDQDKQNQQAGERHA